MNKTVNGNSGNIHKKRMTANKNIQKTNTHSKTFKISSFSIRQYKLRPLLHLLSMMTRNKEILTCKLLAWRNIMAK